MHPISVRFHWFFVPNRIIWANWPNFITGGPLGTDSTSHPYMNFASAPLVSTLPDYLGIPTTTSGNAGGLFVNALPFRAYNNIFNEYYRDEDLQTAITVSTGDGQDTTTGTSLNNICWEKDYLTSSRPWAYKGATVTLPLGTSAPIQRTSNATAGVWYNTGTNTPATTVASVGIGGSGGQLVGSGATALSYDGTGLTANLASATAVDINTVRHAFAVQRFQEARARYGSRYVEYLRYLGVRSSDARLQRPEYLGGGKNTIQFSEVLQTGVTTSGTASGVGTMFGHGITGARTRMFRRFFEEHGIVMCLMSVRPKTMYTNRVERPWLRSTVASGLAQSREDYWQRELQHIGQQGINALEADNSNNAQTVFGYQDRYDEYRRKESSIAGLFRTTLNTWHLSRDFGSPPSLNSTFVTCTPSTRIFADTSNDNLYVCCNHSIQARRLVAREGTSSTY
jgi:hypothetical protein